MSDCLQILNKGTEQILNKNIKLNVNNSLQNWLTNNQTNRKNTENTALEIAVSRISLDSIYQPHQTRRAAAIEPRISPWQRECVVSRVTYMYSRHSVNEGTAWKKKKAKRKNESSRAGSLIRISKAFLRRDETQLTERLDEIWAPG